MSAEREVAQHYAHGRLESAILEALAAAGKNVDALAASDLSAVDEFHLGWRAATFEFAEGLGLSPGLELLDIGSGLGGPARFFAESRGCRVEGVDLTEEYVAVAEALTRRCGLSDKVSFRQGSALDLPYPDASFDRATLIHVGMNIEDKPRLFAEARRVLRPGGRFGVYDVMRMGDGEIAYPTPWAASEATCFLEAPSRYRRMLIEAGFAIEAERNRRELTLTLAQKMREHIEKHGPPPLGLHILMGAEAKTRLGNVMASVMSGAVAPIELVARVDG